MTYAAYYFSPLGRIVLMSDGTALTELDFAEGVPEVSAVHTQKDLPVFREAMRWLDLYFAGRKPDFSPALNPTGTAFQMSVWAILQTIPFGETTTYGAITHRLEEDTGKRMSAQAVGGAVGRNPISIIIPCHRVIGADGSLTGYAGGLDKKEYLLALEGAIE